jgi:hypothetical protein
MLRSSVVVKDGGDTHEVTGDDPHALPVAAATPRTSSGTRPNSRRNMVCTTNISRPSKNCSVAIGYVRELGCARRAQPSYLPFPCRPGIGASMPEDISARSPGAYAPWP